MGSGDRGRDRTVGVLHPDHHAARRHHQALQVEFNSFLARERELGRNDLVFPIHYILVSALLDKAEWRDDPVLPIVAKRQYVDWRNYRRKAVDAPDFGQEIEVFCSKIVKKLREPWLSPEEPPASWKPRPKGAPRTKSAFGRKPSKATGGGA